MVKKEELKEEFLKEVLFPFDEMRDSQKELIRDIQDNLKKKKSMVLHAPTGLGKTISVLGPCLRHAIDNNLTIFFLTSRHTQHKIAIETLKEIKNKFDLQFSATDIIGKKWMCAVSGVTALYSAEFSEYCKSVREDGKCEFYLKTKDSNGKLSVQAKKTLDDLNRYNPTDVEKVVKICTEEELCPYEIATALAAKSQVIIADYNYIFNPNIRDMFFGRTKKELDQCIVIVDEGHNLPNRVKEQLTHKLSNFMIQKAIKEADKNEYEDAVGKLQKIKSCLEELSEDLINGASRFGGMPEKLIKKEDLIQLIESKGFDYQELIADLEFIGDSIREEQKQSFIGNVATFLDKWQGPSEAFVRILEVKDFKGKAFITLRYRCLDPSIATQPVIEDSYCTIAMSGTLSPARMYADIMGFDADDFYEEYESPFPKENRLNLIVPLTTTKYSQRTNEQFKNIGKITAEITNNIPGNSIVFFPSYDLRNKCYQSFSDVSKRTCMLEERGLSKEEKAELLEKFKFYKDTGAVLLATTTGSFGEGIDLPGDFLIASVIVGVPLQRPDIETKETIAYYDNKFGPQRGKFYAYFFPAINRAIQAGGRPFRSPEDKGIVVFLDERYSMPFYIQCFPKEWDLKISRQYNEAVEEFFEPEQKKLSQF